MNEILAIDRGLVDGTGDVIRSYGRDPGRIGLVSGIFAAFAMFVASVVETETGRTSIGTMAPAMSVLLCVMALRHMRATNPLGLRHPILAFFRLGSLAFVISLVLRTVGDLSSGKEAMIIDGDICFLVGVCCTAFAIHALAADA